MKRGLIIGKFLPLHEGHVALIRFAASRCDKLIVSMSYTNRDPIDATLRFSWITEIFKDVASLKVERVPDDFDDESLPIEARTRIWAEVVKKRFPPVDVLFSSEQYGDHFARAMGIPHISFDPERIEFPVSGSLIRSKPMRYWQFIPSVVRPFFVKKVCLYGPESTGKSTMAKLLADIYHTEYVPEVARELITTNSFSVEDIIRIGIAQTQRVLEKTKTANKILFCDTDVITTEIYSDQYLHLIPPILYELEKQVTYDQYFLLDIDVVWVGDGLRDLGHERERMYEVFRGQLEKRKIPYLPVRGTWEERQGIIQACINQILRED